MVFTTLQNLGLRLKINLFNLKLLLPIPTSRLAKNNSYLRYFSFQRGLRFPRESGHQRSNPEGFAERMSLCLYYPESSPPPRIKLLISSCYLHIGLDPRCQDISGGAAVVLDWGFLGYLKLNMYSKVIVWFISAHRNEQ